MYAQVQQRSWSLEKEKMYLVLEPSLFTVKDFFLFFFFNLFFLSSTGSKVLVVSNDWQGASQNFCRNAESKTNSCFTGVYHLLN